MALGFWNDINLPNLEENVLPTKHRATLVLREGRRPRRRAGAAPQALTGGQLGRGIRRLFRLLDQTPRLPLKACVESSDTSDQGRARPFFSRDCRGSNTAGTTPRGSRSSTPTANWACARRPASSRCCATIWSTTRFPTARPASGTPAGRPTADPPTRTPTRTSPTTTSSPSSTTASSRTSPSSRPSCSPRATRSAARPTPRWRPCCSAASTARTAATSSRRSAPTVARLDGAFTLLAMHEEHPGLVVGARRNSPLVIGLGEGENFLALRRRRVRRAHPQRARDRPGRDRRDHARRRRRSPTSPATRSRSSRSK